jgi:hypothetical protein
MNIDKVIKISVSSAIILFLLSLYVSVPTYRWGVVKDIENILQSGRQTLYLVLVDNQLEHMLTRNLRIQPAIGDLICVAQRSHFFGLLVKNGVTEPQFCRKKPKPKLD